MPLEPAGDWRSAARQPSAPGVGLPAERRALKANNILAKTVHKFTARVNHGPMAKPSVSAEPTPDATQLNHWLEHRDGLNNWVRKTFRTQDGADTHDATVDALADVLANMPRQARAPEPLARTDASDAATGVTDQAENTIAENTPPYAGSLMLGYATLSALGSDNPARLLAALQVLPDVVDLEELTRRSVAFVAPDTLADENVHVSRQPSGPSVRPEIDHAVDAEAHGLQDDTEEAWHTPRTSVSDLPNTDQVTHAPPQHDAQADAWRIAQFLAATPIGIDVLKGITGSNAGRAESDAAATLLQAWNALPEQHPDLEAALTAAHAARTDDGNLAPRVLRALSGSVAPKDVAALYAWRQGFRSDAPGSNLKQVQTRLHRFISRGMMRLDKQNWFFQRMFGQKKSALRSMMLGTPSASRASYEKEAARYANALKAACGALAEALRSPRGPVLPPDSPRAREREAAAAALAALSTRPASHIGDLEVDESTRAVLECRAPVAGAMERDEAPMLLDAGALRAVAKQFLVHRWETVKTALDHVDDVGKAKLLQPERLSRDEVKRVLRQLITDIQQSTQVSFADGGRYGVRTGGLSTSTNRGVLRHLPVGGELTLGHYRSRRAMVTLQRNNAGFDIFTGTEQGSRTQAGVGARLGYSEKLRWLGGLRVGGSFGIMPLDREHRNPRGVLIRVARERLTDESRDWGVMAYDDARTTNTALELVDFLFDEAKEPVRESCAETSMFERLAAKIGDRSDISIGWQDTHSKTRRQNIRGTLGASVTPGQASVRGSYGLTGTVILDLNSVNDTSMREEKGSSRYDRQTLVNTTRLSAQGNTSVNPSWRDGDLNGGLPGAVPFGMGGAHLSRLSAGRVMLVARDGRLLNRGCYADQQFVSFDAFAAAVRQSREEWIEMYSKNYHCDYPEASAKLDHDLDLMKTHQRKNQTFLMRRRLKPAKAMRADVYRALEVMHAATGETAPGASTDWSKPLNAMLHERASWLPERIAANELVGREKSTPGLGLPIFGIASESVLAQRELMRSKS
ncbi:hypothetical protein [Robbsia andropogonis]|uniref:hypothetical protein n=1 Tax=Robbsia andropogonis TaxID=28092 RepID=UPI0012FCED83|nr:hypothetical protein [Robbsia andropogonis]